MARRSDHSRDELASLVIEAARGLVISEGSQAVTMRKIAAKIGYAAGSIYNAVGDQESVLRRVNAATLDGLILQLEPCLRDKKDDPQPMERALKIAEAYIDYVAANARLWESLLERPPQPGEPVPEFYERPRARLIGIVAESIRPFFADDAALRRSVIALWSALQGVASLTIGGNLQFVGDGVDPRAIARSIVKRYLTGTE